MARAAKKVEAAYELPFLAHATMEPINTTVHVQPDRCDIWVGTQVPTVAQQLAAQITGLPLEKVFIHNQYLGGGFGRRLEADSIAQAAKFARQVPYPVKIVWSREEDIRHDLYRPAYYDRTPGRTGRRRAAARLGRPRHRRVGHGALRPGRPARGEARRGRGRGCQGDALRLPGHARRLGAPGSAGADHLVARGWADTQRVRRRELPGRARPRRRPGSGGVPARAPRAQPALARRARPRGREGRLGLRRFRPGAAAASRCTTPSAAISRWWPRSRYRRKAWSGSRASWPRSTAASPSTPTRWWHRSRAGSCSASRPRSTATSPSRTAGWSRATSTTTARCG